MTTTGINGQNYLSKSETLQSPEETISKMGRQQILLNNSYNKQADNFSRIEGRKRTRLLVKRGVANISLMLTDIAAIYTKNKLVYVINRDSKKYLIDQSLSELEASLDHSIFFWANRQYIININFVKSFQAYKKVKLLVDINIPELEYPVIISQQASPAFKKWMNDA